MLSEGARRQADSYGRAAKPTGSAVNPLAGVNHSTVDPPNRSHAEGKGRPHALKTRESGTSVSSCGRLSYMN